MRPTRNRNAVSAPAQSSRQELARELEQPEPKLNLARAALLVAREEYPQLPVDPYLARLDLLAEEARDRLGGESAPLVVLQEATTNLFARRKLRGNRDHYYDPRNSFLNDVLDRGLGVPLTLSIVLLEVGWRLGLKLEGVNFPGHFLVRYCGEALPLLVDPYLGGRIRLPEEVLSVLTCEDAPEVVPEPEGGMEAYLRAATKRDMVVRLLTNLKCAYHRKGDYERALAAVERILVVVPTSPVQVRDRGYLLARLGRDDEAVEQLETYLVLAPSASDADRVEKVVWYIKKGENPWTTLP